MPIIDNPADSLSFNRVVNQPKRGLGAASLASLVRFAEVEGLTMPEAAARAGEISDLRPVAAKALVSFSDMLAQIAETVERSPVAEVVDSVLNSTGYVEALQSERTIEAEGRVENLMELVGVAEEYDRRAPEGSLSEFLQEISLYTDIDQLSAQEDMLTLMTIHNAKGLEFPVVFIIGAEEGIFPHSRSLEEQNLDEERRLCYVGMTRAMKKLYFTYTATRNLYGSRSYNMASRFLDEIPQELVQLEEMSPSSRTGYSGIGEQGQDAYEKAEPAVFFAPGDKVVHAVFGDGVVTAVEHGGTVAVRFFDGSERKLMVEYAPLRKK